MTVITSKDDMLTCRRLRTQLAPHAEANFDPPGAAMQRYKEKVSECLDSWTPMHKHRLLEASVVMLDFEEIRQLGLLERSVIHRPLCTSLCVLLHVGLMLSLLPLSSCWRYERRREGLGRNLC